MNRIQDVPIDLHHYRRKFKAVATDVADHDIISAVIIKTAYRRKQWPDAFFTHIDWLEKNDEALAAKLAQVGNQSTWFDLSEARYVNLATGEIGSASDFSQGGLVGWLRALPRLRSLGRMILQERAAVGNQPSSDGGSTSNALPKPDGDGNKPKF